MTHQVQIRNTGHQFPAGTDETILAAALNAGLVLPYGCRDGACGACKGQLIKGSVDYGHCTEKALPESEKANGAVLFCQTR